MTIFISFLGFRDFDKHSKIKSSVSWDMTNVVQKNSACITFPVHTLSFKFCGFEKDRKHGRIATEHKAKGKAIPVTGRGGP
jgi:hypothetical protein